MSVTRPPIPVELLSLRSATRTYMDMLRDVDTWAELVADVNRLVAPKYARQLDLLRHHLAAADNRFMVGSVAGIGLVVAELLGEA